MILSNIDLPLDLLKGLNDTQEKVVKFLHSQIVNIDLNLQNLQSDIKQIKKFDFSDQLTTTFNTLIKKTETNLESQLTQQKQKLLSKHDKLEHNLNEFKDETSKSLEKVSKNLETQTIQQITNQSTKALKTELLNSHIQPLEFELKENYKAIHVLDQSLRVQSWNIESTHKEFNSRFDIHKEKIHLLENKIQEFMAQADNLILQVLAPIKNEVKLSEKNVKDLFSQFRQESKDAIASLESVDFERESKFKNDFEQVLQQKAELEKVLKGFQVTKNLYLQDMNASVNKVNNEFKAFESQMILMVNDLHTKIKSEVLNSYKQEIKVLQDKLKWLPADSENLAEMTQLEARLFTIETRIRAEESNRINQVNDLFQSISNFIRDNKKKKFKEFRELIANSSRSITPIRIPVKVCKSPGGMRILSSLSSKRIKKFGENESITLKRKL